MIFCRNLSVFSESFLSETTVEEGGSRWLTSTVRQAVEDVAFVTVALEAAGGVDAEVVARSVKRALVDVCAERGTDRQTDSEQLGKVFTK